MKYLAYLNILFGDNHVQKQCKLQKGGCPEDHLGIKNWIKNIPVK
jgi:prepilin-type processing-associated H-X9-DG protein